MQSLLKAETIELNLSDELLKALAPSVARRYYADGKGIAYELPQELTQLKNTTKYLFYR